MPGRDEISLKEIFIIIKEWVAYLFSKWLIILIFGISGGILGILYASFSKPEYNASLTFILANNSQSSSGIMGLASQFGIDLSNGTNDAFTGNNIIALMKSRRMVQQALLKKPEGSSQSLLNIYCVDQNLSKAWKKDKRLEHVLPFPDSVAQMTNIQDSLFREVYDNIQKKNLDVSIPDRNQSIYKVTCTSGNEMFSFYLIKYVVDVTSSFYIDTKTSLASNNLGMLQHEADSLRSLLGNTITAAAAQTDATFNLNPAYQVQRSNAQQSQVSAGALAQAYGQVLQNLELAKITLQKETPLYQIVDEPLLPLIMLKPSRTISAIVGGMIAGFLICGFLIIRRIYANLK